ncbi:LysR family transcriptional regulator [Aquincola sp. J276]|uniref:LysR family transcriptional regulator n=1 Tax=Aquincola sp. J276 TaxID=2898432 RepID=UPI00215172B5|nr:LysR family transcriptional regulator [Aquincola sp. J276]MCR5864433.1 LysR family transcriptional regulator [Aquincola sp. J276]
MDQLRAMRTFVEVAERGAFAAAARALDLDPSAVTRQVAELEGLLGARLLVRSTRRVALTPIGQAYLQRVRTILREVDEAAALASHGQHALQGCVRLIAPALFASRQLMPRLARLQARHPGLAVALETGPVATACEDHDISIVVQAGPLDGRFVAHRLAGAGLLLCASPGYLQRHGRPLHPGELARHPLLLAELPRRPRGLRLSHASGAAVEVPAAAAPLHTSQPALCHAGALAGLGIAALPSFAVQEELSQGRLEQVVPDWRLPGLAVHACLPSRRQVPAVVRAMLDFLRAEFPGGTHDAWSIGTATALPTMRLAA